IHQDHRRERKSARAGVLSEMRFADLFDHAGRRRAAGLHGAGWRPARARAARAEAAELVPLGAALGYGTRGAAEKREGRGLSLAVEGRLTLAGPGVLAPCLLADRSMVALAHTAHDGDGAEALARGREDTVRIGHSVEVAVAPFEVLRLRSASQQDKDGRSKDR